MEYTECEGEGNDSRRKLVSDHHFLNKGSPYVRCCPASANLPIPPGISLPHIPFIETRPITSIDELWKWDPPHIYLPPSSYTTPLPLTVLPSFEKFPIPFHLSASSTFAKSVSSPSLRNDTEARPVQKRKHERNQIGVHELSRSKLLMCHDLQGGYLGDRHCFGLSCPWGEDTWRNERVSHGNGVEMDMRSTYGSAKDVSNKEEAAEGYGACEASQSVDLSCADKRGKKKR
jgi:hypothetical protein